jgi:hypothetical protein
MTSVLQSVTEKTDWPASSGFRFSNACRLVKFRRQQSACAENDKELRSETMTTFVLQRKEAAVREWCRRLNILNSSSLTDYRTAQRDVTTNKLVLGEDNA